MKFTLGCLSKDPGVISFDGMNLNTAKIAGKPGAVAHLDNLIVTWSEPNSLALPQIPVAKSPL